MSPTPAASVLSDAPRMRSSAASTLLSRATRTGMITTSNMTLPIHHRTVELFSSTRSGLIGHEETTRHATQSHPRGADTDGEPTGRCGGRRVDGGAGVARRDPLLHVVG